MNINAYKIILSNKTEIQIDEDELKFVVEAINTKSMCKVRQGLFNPSFLVAIVEDEQRLEDFKEEQRKRIDHIKMYPEKKDILLTGFKNLRDVFSQSSLLPALKPKSLETPSTSAK
jgi:hypothetical protein